jgi:hypothetical protein
VRNSMVYQRLAAVRPVHVYRAGLRAEVSIRRFSCRLSSQLGPWLRERVALRPLLPPGISGHLFLRMCRRAFPPLHVSPRRPRKKIVRITS